jgi:chemotaxis protein histidine kinase CheA
MPKVTHHLEQNLNEELARRIETALGGFRAFLQTMETQIMSALTDLQDAMKKLSDDVDTNTTDTAAAVKEITDLLAQIAGGIASGASDADLAALTASAQTLVSKVEASNAALAGAVPPPVPPTA